MVKKLEWGTRSKHLIKQIRPPSLTSDATNTSKIAEESSHGENEIIPLPIIDESKDVLECFFDEFYDFQSISEREPIDFKCRHMFISVSNLCIQDLSILKSVITPLVGEMGPTNLEHLSLDARYGYNATANYNELRINMTYTDVHKIQVEIQTIIKILSDLNHELDTTGSFTTLEKYMNNLELRSEDEHRLQRKVIRKKEKIQDLKSTTRKERRAMIAKTMVLKEELRDVMTVIQDETLLLNTEITVTNQHEEARKEQNLMKLQNKEQEYTLIYQKMQRETELEIFCHRNIEDFINETQNDYQEEILHWMNHYDEEIDRREAEVTGIKHEVDKLAEDLEKIKEEYERRTNDIAEWLQYKAEKVEEQRILQIKIKACMKIQAWWRGIMVRRKLGPYKRKGKRKKDKKSGGKAATKKNKKK